MSVEKLKQQVNDINTPTLAESKSAVEIKKEDVKKTREAIKNAKLAEKSATLEQLRLLQTVTSKQLEKYEEAIKSSVDGEKKDALRDSRDQLQLLLLDVEETLKEMGAGTFSTDVPVITNIERGATDVSNFMKNNTLMRYVSLGLGALGVWKAIDFFRGKKKEVAASAQGQQGAQPEEKSFWKPLAWISGGLAAIGVTAWGIGKYNTASEGTPNTLGNSPDILPLTAKETIIQGQTKEYSGGSDYNLKTPITINNTTTLDPMKDAAQTVNDITVIRTEKGIKVFGRNGVKSGATINIKIGTGITSTFVAK